MTSYEQPHGDSGKEKHSLNTKTWLDSVFLIFIGVNTITTVLSESRNRKLEIIQAFAFLRLSCTLTGLSPLASLIYIAMKIYAASSKAA